MNFNSSDIVAIVAVVVSAFVSIISAYISYKTNKTNLDASQQNNKAIILSKRTEFIFEKQVSVFKDVTLKMDKIIVFIANGIEQNDEKGSNEITEESFFSDLEKEADFFRWFFGGEKFYLPEDVLSAVAEFFSDLKDFIDKRNYDDKRKVIGKLIGKNIETAKLIRIYLGIEEEV